MIIEHGETVYTIRIHVLSVETRTGTAATPEIIPFGKTPPEHLQAAPTLDDAGEPSLLLRVPEVAKLLRMSPSTLYRILNNPSSGLTAVRIGGLTFVDRADLPGFIQSHKQRAQPRVPMPSLPAPRRAANLPTPKRRTRVLK